MSKAAGKKREENRRLAAIMFTDIAGFSKKMGSDESGTIRLLDIHNNIVENVVMKHRGRIIKTIGDAFMVEFTSAVEAVACAMEMQKHLANSNEMIARDDEKIVIRIGIHIGDGVVRGEDILGNGVNIAARLQVLAPPGGICVSHDVLNQVKNRLDVNPIPLGKKHLKNIADPIEVYSIIGSEMSAPWQKRYSPYTYLQKMMQKRPLMYAGLTIIIALLQIFVLPRLVSQGSDSELAGSVVGSVMTGTGDNTSEANAPERSSDESDMYQSMIAVMQGVKKPGELISIAKADVEAHPTKGAAWMTLAAVFESDRRNSNALNAYKRAIQLEPANIVCLLALARIEMSLGNLDDSKSFLENATRLDPKRAAIPKLMWKLGNCMADAQRYQEAVSLHQRSAQLLSQKN
ncbi:MAG: tetratricopeptide repeat protein [Ignavibacteriales bacterium]|nr:tetratricopeptide repeat protein [Ignavibacteriales bacterium]